MTQEVILWYGILWHMKVSLFSPLASPNVWPVYVSHSESIG